MDSYQENLAFEKARFEYCRSIFDQENKKKEYIESKSKFYLSYVTITLGAIILNKDFLELVNKEALKPDVPALLITVIHLSIAFWLLSVLSSLFSIFKATGPLRYRDGCTDKFNIQIFHPESTYFENADELSLLRATASEYSVSVDYNVDLNNKKAFWLRITSFSVVLSVVFLSVLLAAVVFLLTR